MVYSRTYREESIHMNTKTRKIAATGMLCALTYVVMAVGRVPVVLFLKYDPSDIVVTLGGLIWGPMTAFTVSAVVAVIEMLTVSDTGILGCIMNVVQTVSFACTAAVIYRRRRTLGGAVAGLLTGCAVMVAVMMLWNYFLTPLYMGYPREAVAQLLLPAFLPFNLLKSGLNAAFTFLLYKPVVTALRKSGCIEGAEQRGGGRHRGLLLLAAAVIVTCVMLILVLNGMM